MICLNVLLFFSAKAQEDSTTIFIPKTYVGARGGVNLTATIFSPGVAQTLLQGYSYGIGIKHFSQKNVGIQVELNYSDWGWAEPLGPGLQYSRQLTYIEFPFLTHIALGKKNFKCIILLGSYLSFIAKEKENLPPIDLSDARFFYYQQPVQKFSYGVGAGLGFSLDTKIGSFQLEGRYLNALRNVFDLNQLRTNTGNTFSTALNFQIGGYFGYFIKLKGKRDKEQEEKEDPSIF